MKKGNILLVDDNKHVLSALDILLQGKYSQIESITKPHELTSFKRLDGVDIVLLDMNFSAGVNTGNEGLFWLNEIKKRAPEIVVIMMTAYGDVDLAVKALKNGAADFILKPWQNEKLLATIDNALSLQRSKAQVEELKHKESQLKSYINETKNEIIGQSEALVNVLNLTRKVAKTDVTVLVTGENGTGKELIARELHRHSKRHQEVFIPVDMGSISETLFESELFGHTKGSFTDAKTDRIGKIEAANGGTLFLDEIGNLSIQMQSKLLSVLQNREIVKVGSNKTQKIDVRFICATNANLSQMVAEGKFREDLLYRINTIQIQLPALRNRGEDVVLLANHFIKIFKTKYNKQISKLDESAVNKLLNYTWPGNIRELRHTIERAVILSEQAVISVDDLLLNKNGQFTEPVPAKTLEDMEYVMITNALRKFDHNFSAAAESLGITRQTLYNKTKKYNIQ